MNDKKQTGKDNDPIRPGTAGAPDKTPDSPRFPSGVDQGFVFYEE